MRCKLRTPETQRHIRQCKWLPGDKMLCRCCLCCWKPHVKKRRMMKRRDPGWRRGGEVVVRVLPEIPEGDFDPVYQSLQKYLYRKDVAGQSSLRERTPACIAIRAKLDGAAPLVAASTAAEHPGQLLHETLLLRLLPPLLLSIRTLCSRCAVLRLVEVGLAVLELSLVRSCVGRCQIALALPLDLRPAGCLLPWASSGLGSCRSRLWERLV